MKLVLCLAVAALVGLTGCASVAASQPEPDPAEHFSSVMIALSFAVKQVTGDLRGEKHDIRVPGPGVDPCYSLSTNVGFDLDTNLYQDARGNVIHEVNDLRSDLAAVRKDIEDLKNDATVLTNHGATPLAGEPTTVATEQEVIDRIIGKANRDIRQVNQDMAEAYTMAHDKATASCPGVPTRKPPAQISMLK